MTPFANFAGKKRRRSFTAATRRFACSFLLVLTRERALKHARKLSRKTTKRARESPIAASDCSGTSVATTIGVSNDQLYERISIPRIESRADGFRAAISNLRTAL